MFPAWPLGRGAAAMRAPLVIATICLLLALAACQGPAPPPAGPFGWAPPSRAGGLAGGGWFLLGLGAGLALSWLSPRLWRGLAPRQGGGEGQRGGGLSGPQLAGLLASLELLEQVVGQAPPGQRDGGMDGPGQRQGRGGAGGRGGGGSGE